MIQARVITFYCASFKTIPNLLAVVFTVAVWKRVVDQSSPFVKNENFKIIFSLIVKKLQLWLDLFYNFFKKLGIHKESHNENWVKILKVKGPAHFQRIDSVRFCKLNETIYSFFWECFGDHFAVSSFA
jgi:hypothetical protein